MFSKSDRYLASLSWSAIWAVYTADRSCSMPTCRRIPS